VLVVFGGLPGTGKTTIAREVVRRRRAAYLRIDAIEQAIRAAGLAPDVGPAGYAVAYGVAAGNLACGTTVVADCVNPVAETRSAWRSTARAAGVRLVEIEVVCTDAAEHRRRLETRVGDIDGLLLPDWEAVGRHRYDAWREPRLVLDTARLAALDAADLVEAAMA
jgi:predicted kinase